MLPRLVAYRLRVALIALIVLAGGMDSSGAVPAGSLDRLVISLDERLARALEGHPLRRVDLALSVRPGAGVTPELVHTVLGLLQGRLSMKGFRRTGRLRLGADARQRCRRARQQGFELLLDLELVIIEGHLDLRGTLLQTDWQLWRDTLQPERGSQSHLHARVRIDAEVRGYLGAASSSALRFSPRAFSTHFKRILTMSTGDIDGDGRNELVILLPRAVKALSFKGRKAGFVTTHSAELAPPWAALKPRRPVGAMAVADVDGDGRAEILIRTSEMQQGGHFSLKAGSLQRDKDLAGYPVTMVREKKTSRPLLCQLVTGRDLMDAGCLPPAMSGKLPFYTLKGVTITSRGAKIQRYLGVLDGTGQLQLLSGDQPVSLSGLSAVGLAFDLADLDDDGVLEVVTTEAGDRSAKDRITVFRLASGVLRLMWRSTELPGVVTAIAHGDIDGDGRLELVAALEHVADHAVELMVLN